jgi:hypothetical protein
MILGEDETMSVGRSLAVLLAVVVVVGCYIALASSLGITEYWVGFLFLLVWTMVEGASLTRLPHVILGASAGMAIAFSGTWAAPVLGTGGAAVQVASSLIAVFLLIRQSAKIVINVAMMLFLTVMSIPHIGSSSSPVDLYLGLVAGIAFFGTIGFAAWLLMREKSTEETSGVGVTA